MIARYENGNLSTDGLPYAFYNFSIRRISDENAREVDILYKELKNDLRAPGKLFDDLFAIYRVGKDIRDEELLTGILTGNYDVQSRTYALGIFRKQKYFPDNSELFTKIITDTSWSIRCEGARTICYHSFVNIESITSYLNLIKDNNPNVARSAAQSAALLNIPDSTLKEKYISRLIDLLNSDEITYNAKGELVVSLHSMGARPTKELVEQYKDDISDIYLYALLGSSPDDIEYSFNYLLKELVSANERNKVFIHSQIAGMFDTLRTNQVFIKYLYDIYKSGSPISVAIYNETLDSAFVTENSGWLQQVIVLLFRNKLTDFDYSEALASTIKIAEQIDTGFANQLLGQIESSYNYSLQHMVSDKITTGEKYLEYRNKIVNELINYAFSGKNIAVVTTTAGEFTLELYPSIAPISVGNFMRLSELGVFNNVYFHRVVPDFVVQTGDPTGTGWGGPGYTILSEFSPLPFDTYYAGMASSGKDTEGSQWFVMQNNYPHLNGRYTNFGKVISGFETIANIDENDKVISIEIKKP